MLGGLRSPSYIGGMGLLLEVGLFEATPDATVCGPAPNRSWATSWASTRAAFRPMCRTCPLDDHQAHGQGNRGFSWPLTCPCRIRYPVVLKDTQNEDAVLLDTICSAADHLVSVGWLPSFLPSLMSESYYLDKFTQRNPTATGMELKKAVAIAIASC